MPITTDALPKQLATGTLKPVWLVFGKETLLVLESADAIRDAARKTGCIEREIFNVDRSFDWGQLRDACASQSLFGDRKIVELRFDKAPPRESHEPLMSWCSNPPDDAVLIVTAGELDKKQMGAAWFSAVESVGTAVEAKAVERAQLPDWIAQRLKKHGVTATKDALALMADRIEGNLLAAQQEIDRIALLYGKGEIGIAQLDDMVADNARYEFESPLNAALAGDGVRALKMLSGLREEGESPVPILIPIQRDVRGMLIASELLASGRREGDALQAAGIWGKRQPAVMPALRRLKPLALRALLADCAKCEKVNKGQLPGESWDALATVLLRIAGQKAPAGTGRDIV